MTVLLELAFEAGIRVVRNAIRRERVIAHPSGRPVGSAFLNGVHWCQAYREGGCTVYRVLAPATPEQLAAVAHLSWVERARWMPTSGVLR